MDIFDADGLMFSILQKIGNVDKSNLAFIDDKLTTAKVQLLLELIKTK